MDGNKKLAFINIPALGLPVNVGVLVTSHSSIPLTPVISAHTCTDADATVSATVAMSVTIWIAAVVAAM